jgi:8-oxo-dGTP pyrophosphatase MutT (NUDIX family)
VLPTDLTVAAVVERDGSFLIIEESVSEQVVVTQPGGHIETGEAPEDAARREVFEEAACDVDITDLIGVYLWIHPQSRQQFLRIVYAADLVKVHRRRPPDTSIHAVHWFSRADLLRRSASFRSPVVMRCLDDYLAGQRQPNSLFSKLKPIQKHVDSVLANARLI